MKENKQQKDNQKLTGPQSDPETLNTTDPQEHMHGPVSDAMHNASHSFDKEPEENQEVDQKPEGKE